MLAREQNIIAREKAVAQKEQYMYELEKENRILKEEMKDIEYTILHP